MLNQRLKTVSRRCCTIGVLFLLGSGSAHAARKSIYLSAASTRLDDLGPWSPAGYVGPVTEGVHRISAGAGTEWGFSFFRRMEFTLGAQYIQRHFRAGSESYRAHLVQVPLGLLFKLPFGLYATGGFALQQSLSMANITAGSAVATTPGAIGLKPLLGRLYFGGGLVFPIGRGGNGLILGAQYFTDQDNASENFPNKRLFRDMQVQLGWTFSK